MGILQKSGEALKRHKNGFLCLAFASATAGAVYASYLATKNLNTTAVFTLAACAPVLGDLAYRQLREWWKKEAEFLKRQGAGYIIGQVSGLTGGLAFVFGAAAYKGLEQSDMVLAGVSGALCGLFTTASLGLVIKGNACLKQLRKIDFIKRSDFIAEDVRYSRAMAGFTAFRRFAKTVAYAGIIAGGMWLNQNNEDQEDRTTPETVTILNASP